MSKDCKLRFKGIENFLRRVAFNLGNTPSQTEVKIISCIPIDVTDLQHKITELEKQLELALNNRRTSVVHTAIFRTPSQHSNAAINCQISSSSLHKYNCQNNRNGQSNISLLFHSESSPTQSCRPPSTDISEMINTEKCKHTIWRKNFFTKRRKLQKRKKVNTQLVYYAQNEDRNPFNSFGLFDDGTSKNRGKEENITFNKTYLTDIIRKQYRPNPVNEGTNVSEFSTPICRDVIPTQIVDPKCHPYQSDMCSCCHGQFHNIDNHASKHRHFNITSPHNDSSNTYYDSNNYDVVPVKEHAVKLKKFQTARRKELRNEVGISAYWPETIRPSYNISPMIVNNHTLAPMQQHVIRKVPVQSMNRKEIVLNKMANLNTEINATRSIEFGKIYAKRLKKTRNKIKILKSTPKNVTKLNDTACLTTAIVSTECQTTSVSYANSQDKIEVKAAVVTKDKTEVTLNQIKSILQSVLAEVKTNISNNTDKAKKDAVVQNGPSQSNIYGGSSLLQSYTYSPYSDVSCPQQKPTTYFSNIPLSPLKCLQHYPLLVQVGRNNCTNCNRSNFQVNKTENLKRAASAATNTEQYRTRSRETENLIKEIYKSIAPLHEEFPKGTPTNVDINDTDRNYNFRSGDRESRRNVKAISEIFKYTKPFDTLVTPVIERTPVSNESNFKSQPVRDCRQSTRKEVEDYCSNNVNTETVDNEETEHDSQELESDEDSDDTIVNKDENESISSITETESDDVVISAEEPDELQKKQKGLFSKILKIFKPRMKVTKSEVKDYSSESDSDDNQTVYSKNVSTAKLTLEAIKGKARSKVFCSKQKPRHQGPSRSVSQRSPYMKQELTLHDKEKIIPREKKFEARTASVDPYTRARVQRTRRRDA